MYVYILLPCTISKECNTNFCAYSECGSFRLKTRIKTSKSIEALKNCKKNIWLRESWKEIAKEKKNHDTFKQYFYILLTLEKIKA